MIVRNDNVFALNIASCCNIQFSEYSYSIITVLFISHAPELKAAADCVCASISDHVV